MGIWCPAPGRFSARGHDYNKNIEVVDMSLQSINSCIDATIDFVFDYAPRPLIAACTNPLASFAMQVMAVDVAPAALRIATMVGAVVVSFFDKLARNQDEDQDNSLLCLVGYEALQLAVTVPLSACIYYYTAVSSGLSVSSLIIGSTVAYTISKVIYLAAINLLDAALN
jgi:hypothetical protein